MASNKNRRKDLRILQHIRDRQLEILADLKYYDITCAESLTVNETMRPAVRRGLVQMVGDIFELTNGMRDETKQRIGLNFTVIRQFRNTASHNYGKLSNQLIYACIMHCVDSIMLQNILEEIDRLKQELNNSK